MYVELYQRLTSPSLSTLSVFRNQFLMILNTELLKRYKATYDLSIESYNFCMLLGCIHYTFQVFPNSLRGGGNSPPVGWMRNFTEGGGGHFFIGWCKPEGNDFDHLKFFQS